ncbi:MAG: leucine-rich repeat domain-containing protein, partial [Alistipes sp.]|nr:leucine-rich repeat domain-containing protein [Alistipes sp.]
TLNGNWDAMDESRDAFTGYFNVQKYSASSSINIPLTRPFAKLRVITTDVADLAKLGLEAKTAKVVYTTPYRAGFNAATGTAVAANEGTCKTHETFAIAPYGDNNDIKQVLFTDYFFATEDVVKFELAVYDQNNNYFGSEEYIKFNTDIPVKRNYLTTIQGNVLTDGNNITVEVKDAFEGNVDYDADENKTTTTVNTAEEFAAAFDNDSTVDVVVLNGDINLNDLITRAAYTALTIKNGKTLTIDLNGNKLLANTYENSGNQELFLVKGTLTVKNGTIEYEHLGDNMGWGAMTTIFDVTAGGVLNLEGVTATNKGGSDMNFVAHLNNWGKVTLNVENCTLESTYVPVRVFNSGPDMNNVTIKNSTLKGVSAAFWVHNYTAEDFGSEAKAEAQKALLNLNIYNQGNTFSPDLNGLRYGFTNSVRTDAYGIIKTVSEDGTEVTLGSIIENGLIRRGVAGAEENTTIKKVVVEEGVGVLYDRTFRRFYALEEVVLPSTLTTIGAAGSGVFQSCTNLKKVVLPESLTVLGKGSFQECTSLESINIPAGVTRIESDALRNTGLKKVEFHAGVTYFGAQAFRDCKQLTEVVINASEFTMEGNTFGIMAAPYTPMTIYVANAEMKAYVESKLTAHCKTYITVVAPEVASTTAALQAALANGERVILANDLTISPEEMTTAPYGNKMALSQNGGIFDGNGKNISVTAGGDNYVVMTNGGTIKNLDIDRGFRGILLMNPNQDVYVDNVKIGVDDEVCYTINTAEGNNGKHNLYVSNSTLNGWCSIGDACVKFVSFTNCTFGQGTYYIDVYGRLVKPYVDALFENCDFCNKCYIDLSAFVGTKVTLKNCTVNGVKITAENWTSLVAPEDTCGEGQISVELKDGTYLTAENVADYIVFE